MPEHYYNASSSSAQYIDRLTYGISCGGSCNLVGNQDLKEETSVNKEVSLLMHYETWSASITAFHNDIDNMINVSGAEPLPEGGYTDRYYENLDKTVLKGVEVTSNIDLTDSFNLDLNYTHLNTEVNGDEPLTYRAEHKANLKLNWAITDITSTYVNASYYGDYVHATWTDPDTEFSGFTTVDFGGHFSITEHLTLRAGMTNLTDEQPKEEDPESYLYLKGRTAFVGAQYDF